MKNQIDNPNGLHARYKITKIQILKNPNYGVPPLSIPYGKRRVDKEFIVKEVSVDKNSEYFVLRLDINGSDIEHIKACRIAVNAYANAIKNHLPQLSKELIEKYPTL